MKRFAFLVAAVAAMFVANEAFAQQWGHNGHRGRSSFSISVGNGFNGFHYGRGYGAYGGFAPVSPIYTRPVINYYGGRPFYGGYGTTFNYNYGRPIYGGYYGGGFRGGCGW